MAGRGPAPKPPAERRRRTPGATPSTEVKPDAQLRGADLPKGYDWPQRTRDWWMVWRRSPQAQTWIETDWQFALDTAFVHAEFVLGDMKLAPELRQREAKLGMTPEDRLRLKMEILPPDQPETGTKGRTAARKPAARSARDPRARLKVVGDGEAS